MVYFMYSKTQLEERSKQVKSFGSTFVPGKVLVNGTFKIYTEITDAPESIYSDALLITKGEIEDINYTEPEVE